MDNAHPRDFTLTATPGTPDAIEVIATLHGGVINFYSEDSPTPEPVASVNLQGKVPPPQLQALLDDTSNLLMVLFGDRYIKWAAQYRYKPFKWHFDKDIVRVNGHFKVELLDLWKGRTDTSVAAPEVVLPVGNHRVTTFHTAHWAALIALCPTTP